MNSFFAKVVFGSSSNGSLKLPKCPIPIGPYNFNNMYLDNSFFPPFPSLLFPEGFIRMTCLSVARGKVRGKKSLDTIYEFKIFLTGYNGDVFKNLDELSEKSRCPFLIEAFRVQDEFDNR